MKKIISVILFSIIFSSLFLMSGCSDFTFNPIGKWKLEIADEDYEDFNVYTFEYIFEKSGTGYITANGSYTNNIFTYEYDNDTVYISTKSPKGEVSEAQAFKLKDDKLISNGFEYTAENGQKINDGVVRILIKE